MEKHKTITIHIISLNILSLMHTTFKQLWKGGYKDKLYFIFILPGMFLTFILTFLLDLCGLFKITKSRLKVKTN